VETEEYATAEECARAVCGMIANPRG